MSQVKGFFILFCPPADSGPPAQTRSYLLRSGRHHPTLRGTSIIVLATRQPPFPVFIPLLDRHLQQNQDQRTQHTTGTFNHILIRCSICRSTILRATHCRSSECGIVSKYFDKSASTTSVYPSCSSSSTFRIASCALFCGRYP